MHKLTVTFDNGDDDPVSRDIDIKPGYTLQVTQGIDVIDSFTFDGVTAVELVEVEPQTIDAATGLPVEEEDTDDGGTGEDAPSDEDEDEEPAPAAKPKAKRRVRRRRK